MLGLSFVTLCLTLGADVPAQGISSARRITVEDAVQIVTQRLPQLRASRARMEASDAVAKSARGRMLPALRLSDSQAWVKTKVGASSDFLPGTSLGALTDFPEDIQYNMFNASVKQPLLGLVHLGHDYAGAEKNADAGIQDFRAATADAMLQLRSNFLRYLEAKAVGETALSSQKDLEEQVGVAQSKVNAGVLTTADVLRLKVAAANARQQVIAADGQAASTRAWLFEVLGMGGEATDDVELVAPEALANPPAAPASVRHARDEALVQPARVAGAQAACFGSGPPSHGANLGTLPRDQFRCVLYPCTFGNAAWWRQRAIEYRFGQRRIECFVGYLGVGHELVRARKRGCACTRCRG